MLWRIRSEPFAAEATDQKNTPSEKPVAETLPAESAETIDSADSRLRTVEARYRALVEQIPAVTFMAPLDGSQGELYVSPQIDQLLGFSAKEWLEDPVLWFRQLHPDDKELWQDQFARTVNSGEPFQADYRFLARWPHGLGSWRSQGGGGRTWAATLSAGRRVRHH